MASTADERTPSRTHSRIPSRSLSVLLGGGDPGVGLGLAGAAGGVRERDRDSGIELVRPSATLDP